MTVLYLIIDFIIIAVVVALIIFCRLMYANRRSKRRTFDYSIEKFQNPELQKENLRISHIEERQTYKTENCRSTNSSNLSRNNMKYEMLYDTPIQRTNDYEEIMAHQQMCNQQNFVDRQISDMQQLLNNTSKNI